MEYSEMENLREIVKQLEEIKTELTEMINREARWKKHIYGLLETDEVINK